MTVLLFDLYGVLLRTQDADGLARIEQATGHSGEEFWAAYWGCRHGYDAGTMSAHEYWAAVGDQLGAPIRDVEQAHEQDLRSWMGSDPEMIAYVTGLIGDGVRVALLSNIPVELAERVLVSFDWLARFEPLILSGRTGLAKPDPRLFERAVEATGVAAGDILFIDDRLENVEAAQSVGLQGHVFIGIDDLRPVIERALGRD
ncbi:putative hydrolase of the HAD superfamily [Kineosphaera limosa]|uniref:Putative hydrolase n=1 Tax=Kineosphaera limosa NBRC 100340 TaxID=1184609 RepID=K6W756_9MICO|nr:HAD family phosphatase [Kineosphaera limosa]NYE00509.1 putative hydrolase of the HAD superfamily [Kineosphaera limosa]GAB95025.1 putative hydrolase [Kineosphaera limosa NBRC 100340]